MKKRPLLLLAFFAAFSTFLNAQKEVQLVREGDFFGFKNAKNEWVIAPKYELFDGPFGDFMVAQNEQKLRGAINRKGDTLVPFEFRFIRLSPAGNFVDVQTEKGERGIWDLKGRELVAPRFGSLNFLTDSLFVASLFDGENLGLFDVTGRERMPCDFAEIRAVGPSNRLKARKKGELFALFDAEGNDLTFPKLADFEAHSELPNLIFYKEEDGKWSILSHAGRHLHFPPFDSYGGVTELGFVAKSFDLSAIFSAEGKQITPHKYRYVQIFDQKNKARKDENAHGLNAETYFIGSTNDGGEWRLIDNFGKEYPLEPVKPQPKKPKPADDDSGVAEVKAADDPQKIYDYPEKKPQFPGGETALFNFISENLKYPTEAKTAAVQGRVFVQFVVEKDGSVTSPILLKDIGSGCGAAAIEVVKKMPRWSPAEQNGRPVRAKYLIPFSFKL